MFLNSVTFLEDFRCYKKDEKIEFNDKLTVITGDNGSGKSTLISSIRSMFKIKWSFSDDPQCYNKVVLDCKNLEGKLTYLDLTQDLYKTSPEIQTHDIDTYLSALHSSSGEGSFLQILKLIEKEAAGSDLLILDEPERGLSIKKQNIILKIIDHINKLHPNLQIILITHSDLLMCLNENVFSTSHKKYISIQEYMKWMFEV